MTLVCLRAKAVPQRVPLAVGGYWMPRFRGHDKRAFRGGPYFGVKISLNSPCHFFCSSPPKIVAMIFLSFNLSVT